MPRPRWHVFPSCGYLFLLADPNLNTKQTSRNPPKEKNTQKTQTLCILAEFWSDILAFCCLVFCFSSEKKVQKISRKPKRQNLRPYASMLAELGSGHGCLFSRVFLFLFSFYLEKCKGTIRKKICEITVCHKTHPPMRGPSVYKTKKDGSLFRFPNKNMPQNIALSCFAIAPRLQLPWALRIPQDFGLENLRQAGHKLGQREIRKQVCHASEVVEIGLTSLQWKHFQLSLRVDFLSPFKLLKHQGRPTLALGPKDSTRTRRVQQLKLSPKKQKDTHDVLYRPQKTQQQIV